MPKVLFQLYIDVEQFNTIAQKAEETGRSRAAIVREWIDRGKQEEDKEKNNG